jgi:hypothetical protein
MKKLSTTFGLLALMLIVTSFTTPYEIGGGGKGTPGNKDLGQIQEIGGGGKGTPGDKDLGQIQEIGGGGKGTPGDRGMGGQ